VVAETFRVHGHLDAENDGAPYPTIFGALDRKRAQRSPRQLAGPYRFYSIARDHAGNSNRPQATLLYCSTTQK
jgi:hypothetical protein